MVGAAGGAAVWAYLAAGLLVIRIGLSYAEGCTVATIATVSACAHDSEG